MIGYYPSKQSDWSFFFDFRCKNRGTSKIVDFRRLAHTKIIYCLKSITYNGFWPWVGSGVGKIGLVFSQALLVHDCTSLHDIICLTMQCMHLVLW